MFLLLASCPYLPLPLSGMTGPGAPVAAATALEADDTADAAADDADDTADPAADDAAETAEAAADEADDTAADPPLLSPPQAAATKPRLTSTATAEVPQRLVVKLSPMLFLAADRRPPRRSGLPAQPGDRASASLSVIGFTALSSG